MLKFSGFADLTSCLGIRFFEEERLDKEATGASKATVLMRPGTLNELLVARDHHALNVSGASL